MSRFIPEKRLKELLEDIDRGQQTQEIKMVLTQNSGLTIGENTGNGQ